MLSFTLTILLACSSNSEQTETKTESTQQTVQKDASKTSNAKPAEQLNLAKEDPKTAALTPSPRETRLAAERAGLTTTLASLIPKRNFDFQTENTDHIAMRTGIILADTVLSISEIPKSELENNLGQIQEGLTKMKAGKGLLSMISDIQVQVKNDSLTRKELLSEMEDIVSMSVPEHGFGKEDKTGPLLQAGAWLSSINLMCKAIQKENNLKAANTLLRHGKVAEYFLSYAGTEGKGKAPEAMITHLKTALSTLKKISEKEDINSYDIQQIINETNALLALV